MWLGRCVGVCYSYIIGLFNWRVSLGCWTYWNGMRCFGYTIYLQLDMYVLIEFIDVYKYTNLISLLDAAHMQLFSIMKASLKNDRENSAPHWINMVNHDPQGQQHLICPVRLMLLSNQPPTGFNHINPTLKKIISKPACAQLVQHIVNIFESIRDQKVHCGEDKVPMVLLSDEKGPH